LTHQRNLIAMAPTYETERKSARKPLDVHVQIFRHDGSSTEAQCVDASDDGFGIRVGAPLEVGEILRLVIGRKKEGPSFAARVVWQHDERVGLFCIGAHE
jgi:hypothetical protein